MQEKDDAEAQEAASKNQIMIDVTQATLEGAESQDVFGDYVDADADDVSDIEVETLEKSMPSTQLRRVKSLARPGNDWNRYFLVLLKVL